MEIIASHVDVIQMRIFPPRDTVTISLGSAWLVLETQGAGTVTPVFQAIMVTLGMDSVSPVSVTCMGQGIQSVIQEQGNACVRKSMLGGLVGNARMDLVQ